MTYRSRPIELHVFLSEKENQIFEKKYKQSGKRSRSEYIRQLILEGFVYEINFSEIQRFNYLLANISNNINQVAHKVNATDSVFKNDIEAIKEEQKKIWQLQRSMLSSLLLEKR